MFFHFTAPKISITILYAFLSIKMAKDSFLKHRLYKSQLLKRRII